MTEKHILINLGEKNMTEKRFEKTTSDIRTFRIYDYEMEDAYFIDCDEHTVECLVDLLNGLHEENQKLKEEIQKWYNTDKGGAIQQEIQSVLEK